MSGYFTNVCIHYTSTAGVRKEALAGKVVVDMDDKDAAKYAVAGYLREATKGEIAEFAPEAVMVEKAASKAPTPAKAPKPPAAPKAPATQDAAVEAAGKADANAAVEAAAKADANAAAEAAAKRDAEDMA